MSLQQNPSKPVRIFMDGCFDVCHFGHANAIRKAKELGDVLVVGVHCDEEILIHKGPPVFTTEERLQMVKSIKWIDEIVVGVPYKTQVATLTQNNCNFIAHGDDYTISADGRHSYEEVVKAGVYKEFKRTKGVSTTDIVRRILRLIDREEQQQPQKTLPSDSIYLAPNSLRISQFASECRDPLPGETVIYAPGAYDMFHVGHVAFLEKCKQLGAYVIVGVYPDHVVRSFHGSFYPIMTLTERILCVLANKNVSNVIMGAPLNITEELLDLYDVDLVVTGAHSPPFSDEEDPFKLPKDKGIFKSIDSGSDLSTRTVLQRIWDNKKLYEERNEKMAKKQQQQLIK